MKNGSNRAVGGAEQSMEAMMGNATMEWESTIDKDERGRWNLRLRIATDVLKLKPGRTRLGSGKD